MDDLADSNRFNDNATDKISYFNKRLPKNESANQVEENESANEEQEEEDNPNTFDSLSEKEAFEKFVKLKTEKGAADEDTGSDADSWSDEEEDDEEEAGSDISFPTDFVSKPPTPQKPPSE